LKGENEEKTIVLVYVDDLIIVTKSEMKLAEIKAQMKSIFKMKDLGEVSLFLGMEITRKKEENVISITQTKMIKKIVKEFNQEDSKVSSTPMDERIKLKEGKDVADADVYPCEFRKLIGCLLYLSTHTRPDISQAVSVLSRNLDRPTEEHWIAGLKIVNYLKGTAMYGLLFKGKGLTLNGYSDASWGSTSDMKSISGYIFIMNNSAVSWKSKKQTIVALSSTESEYVALSEALKEALWLKKLLVSLNLMNEKDQIKIKEDNESCIKLSKNDTSHGRMKHVNLKYHFIRDYVQDGTLLLEYCSTDKMLADMFTKPLGLKQFTYLRNEMSITTFEDSIHRSREGVKIAQLNVNQSDNDAR
jgi:hypothetical protein